MPPSQETSTLLEKRGPDSYRIHTVSREAKTQDGVSQGLTYHLTFISTVLSLRGDYVSHQPLVDATTDSVLCWNGEAWKIAGQPISGNDTARVFDLLLQAVSGASDRKHAAHNVAEAVGSISGPFAFVFYDATNAQLFFSRDCLGRRSLLQGWDQNDDLKICSLCDGSSASEYFEEVGFDGVYMIDLAEHQNPSLPLNVQLKVKTLPWSSETPAPAGHIVCFRSQSTRQILTFSAEESNPANEHVYP